MVWNRYLDTKLKLQDSNWYPGSMTFEMVWAFALSRKRIRPKKAQKLGETLTSQCWAPWLFSYVQILTDP
jgi:hypothetical protein